MIRRNKYTIEEVNAYLKHKLLFFCNKCEKYLENKFLYLIKYKNINYENIIFFYMI